MTVLAKPGFKFEPSQIKVEKGTKVALTLKNVGRMSHNLHIPALEVKTETIAPDKTDTVRFMAKETGTFVFRCEVPGHTAAGMTGEITVQ